MVGRVFLLLVVLGAEAQAQCLPGSDCCGAQPRQSVVAEATAGRGDGQGDAAGFSRTYVSLADPAQTPVPRTWQVTDACTVASACSPGSVRYEWECAANGLPAHEKAVKNKRDAWEVYTYAPSAADAGIPAPVLERTAVKRGAQDMAGTGALEEEYFSYSYGPGAQQQLASSEKPSLLGGAGARARTFHRYDASGRLVATLRSGWTQTLSTTTGAAAIEKRWVGTFYRMQRTGEPTADPLGRVVEVHGPCWVDSESATDCPAGPTYPLTQRFYWADSEATLFRANRLKKVARFPAGLSSTPIATQFNAYDAAGNVTESLDANGVTTLSTWAGSRLLTQTVRATGLVDVVTRHGYDEAGHLAWTQRPEGNYEVYCYRTGTPAAACGGGQLTGLLQWKARSAVSDGASWAEKVSYTYWPDGSQKEERFLDATGATRRVHSYAADAHLRPTLERWGEGPGSYTLARAFDGADNVTGVGLPYNTPPAWCSAGAAGNPAAAACGALRYDRANRLVEIAERPSDTVNQRTMFRHDAHGNVAAMKVGCLSGETFDTCTQPTSTYTHDDFGNLIEVFHPYMNGVTRYAYDALGNRVVHQSSVMRAVQRLLLFGYDHLSRLRTKHTRYIDANTAFLHHKLGYDSEETPPAGCETQLKSMGRLRYREDSFGRTWYQYDDLGRVVREMKIRASSTGCNLGPNLNPDTRYGYTPNGNLSSLTYPHGRKVTYVYGTGANADRVSAVDVTQYDGTAWQTRRLLSGVVWEPYGDLRGYQQHHFGSGATRSVEYMLGDNASVAPVSAAAACADTPPSLASADATGRPRALRVSSGAPSLGAGTGDIYSRTYTWAADQVSRIDTCLLDSAEAQTEEFTYDRLMRLTKASRPTGNFAATGGTYSSRTYGFDRRGNRNTMSEEGASSTMPVWSVPTPDLLYSRTWGQGAILNDLTGFDGDGRVSRKSTGRVTAGDAYAYFNLYPAETPRGGDFKSMGVGLAYYQYWYDAFGRRRLKDHPSGAKDEYFHDLGRQLLSDRSSDQVLAAASYYVEDDYVWLGGRPVAVVRGKFSTQWSRLADSSAQCTRAGTEATCGFRFIVTDPAGKPVLLLDEDGRITGTGEYEPFGHVNRVTHVAATANPYPDNLDVELTRFRQPARSASLKLQQRVLFNLVDTEPVNDFVLVKDGPTGATLAGPLSGKEQVLTWTGWLEPGNGELAVRFVSNTSCAASACVADAGVPVGCTCAPATRTRGVVMQAYEYRRFEAGASPFWIPLRAAGQYFDEELDLFEEYDRTYDPTSGRYFQPEPRMLDPEFVAWSALQGRGTNLYGYANHNPVGVAPRDEATGMSLPLAPVWNSHPAPGASLTPDPQLPVQLKHVLGSGEVRPDGKGQ